MHRALSRSAALAALLAAIALPGTGRAAGDPEAGKTSFTKICGACHSVAAGQNKIGPSLHGVVGRGSAQVEGFNYSPAMKAANKTWDEPTLSAYLENPRGVVNGTRMILAGVKSEQERENIIAYLAQQK